MSTSTIEITGGVTERTSRLGLKKTMLQFGEVDACHMGDRAVMGDNFTEFPIVRFKSQSSAEAALSALKAGHVFLDGYQLSGEWRGGGGQAVRQRKAHAPPALTAQPFEDTSSRLLWDAPVSTQGRSTFAGRDQRRTDREEATSRTLFDAPPVHLQLRDRVAPLEQHSRQGKQRSRSPPRRRSPSARRRSTSCRRSRSRRRARSRKRSVSASRKKPLALTNGTSGSSTSKVNMLALLRLQDTKEFGNVESAISDNPLFKGARR